MSAKYYSKVTCCTTEERCKLERTENSNDNEDKNKPPKPKYRHLKHVLRKADKETDFRN